MKLLLLILLPFSLLAQTIELDGYTITITKKQPPVVVDRAYYISANGSDNNNGSINAPWKTLSKVKEGDVVLLKRGDVFSPITIDKKITISAYGTGAAPLITTLVTPTWNSAGNNLWQASTQATSVMVNNGKIQPFGLSPAYTITAGSGTNITAAVPINYTGAELVIKENDWSYNKAVVTSQIGSTFNLSNAINPGYKTIYFQNHPATLTAQGNWTNIKGVTMYSSTIPNVLVSTTANAVTFNAAATIKGVTIEGSVQVNSDGVTIDSSVIRYAFNGVSNDRFKNLTVSNTTITQCLNNAIRSYGDGLLVNGNTISDIGMHPGMGQQMHGYNGIAIGGIATVKNNNINNTGYNGILFSGVSNIDSNRLELTNNILDDGAAIYTGKSGSGSIIQSNVVTSVKGMMINAGIYTDDEAERITIKGNTVSNSPIGIYQHNNQNNTISGNTFNYNQRDILYKHDGGSRNYPIRGITTSGNTHTGSKLVYDLVTDFSNDFNQFGKWESNNITGQGAIRTDYGGVIYYDVPAWQRKYGYDVNSKYNPVPAYTYASTISTLFNNNYDRVAMYSGSKAAASFVRVTTNKGRTDIAYQLNTTQKTGDYIRIRFTTRQTMPGHVVMLNTSNYQPVSPEFAFSTAGAYEFIYKAESDWAEIVLFMYLQGDGTAVELSNFVIEKINVK